MECSLDRYLTEFTARSRDEAIVDASPDRVWSSLQELDLRESRIIRVLFALRGLRAARGLEALRRTGFITLEERAPELLILGLIGKFWTPGGRIRRVEPDEFEAFDEPGFAKAVWSFELAPLGRATHIATETRVQTIGLKARRAFRVYWTVVAPFSGWTRKEMLRLVKAKAMAKDSGFRLEERNSP